VHLVGTINENIAFKMYGKNNLKKLHRVFEAVDCLVVSTLALKIRILFCIQEMLITELGQNNNVKNFVFRCFPHSLQANTAIETGIIHDWFLPHSSQFTLLFDCVYSVT
jgi:hypothetical protein